MFDRLKRIFRFRRLLTADQILKYPESKRIYQEFHNLRSELLDEDAVKVIYRIQQFGYRAFIVGGSVRDLLLGRQPKDYDIVTNAHPNEIRRLFANSRVIGRRFKIVHIVFRGNKIIEVSTARSLPQSRFTSEKKDDNTIQRDNDYGSFKDDAARRDFSINSLFFDVRNETIIDYTGGFEDIKEKVVKIIGDEDVSLPEDPVRMLRAVKFAALLDFSMHPKLIKGIRKHRKLIQQASEARLHEEYNKIFRTGQTGKVLAKMSETGLFEALFPTLAKGCGINEECSEGTFHKLPIGQRLSIADRMISEHEDINSTIYYALFVIDCVRDLIEADLVKRDKGLDKKVRERLQPMQKELGLTRKESERLEQMFSVQNAFRQEHLERKGWVKDFHERSYFLEAFILYKIDSRAQNDDESLQKALFWEIGLRQKLPQAIRKITQRSITDSNAYYTGSAERARLLQPEQSQREPNDRQGQRDRTGGRSQRSRRPNGGNQSRRGEAKPASDRESHVQSSDNES